MGRNSTGVWSTQECRKLDLKLMLKFGWIKKGCKVTGQMSWTDESTAYFESVYTDHEKYLRMVYTITDRQKKETNYDYKINLVTVPSNLSKGEILHFECPESLKRARVLYSAYRHPKYLHRDWYKERYGVRIYYLTQQYSKNDYDNTRYHELDKQVNKLEIVLFAKHSKLYYKGKPTKGLLKLEKLKEQREYHDMKRLKIFYNKWDLM